MADPVDVVILTVIRSELLAAKKALKLAESYKDPVSGTVSWHGTVDSVLCDRSYRVALACIGEAGNPPAATMATELLTTYKPRAFLLMGIAAGIRGKVQIGHVVFSERVVAYEPGALVELEDGTSSFASRPESERIPPSMRQDVVHYDWDAQRINHRFRQIDGRVPRAPKGANKTEWQAEVAKKIHVLDTTIASGDKLLRDPGKLIQLRKDVHGKIEVGEMEAAGIVDACRKRSVPWLVIRGISDYGDRFKDDRFHDFASRRAAAVLADFLAHGLRLGPGARVAVHQGRESGTGAPILPWSDADGHPHRDEFEQLCSELASGRNQMVELIAPPWSRKGAVLEELRRHAEAISRFVIFVDCIECTGLNGFWGVVAEELKGSGIEVGPDPGQVRRGLQKAGLDRPLYLLRRFDEMLVHPAGPDAGEILRHLQSHVDRGFSAVLTSVVPTELHVSAALHGSPHNVRSIPLHASDWDDWSKRISFDGARPASVALAREHRDEASLAKLRRVIAHQIWARTPDHVRRVLSRAACGEGDLTHSTHPVDLLIESGLLRDEGGVIVPADPDWGPVWRQNGRPAP